MSGSEPTAQPHIEKRLLSRRMRFARNGGFGTLMFALLACSANPLISKQALADAQVALLGALPGSANATSGPVSLPIGACINLSHFAPSMGGETSGKRLDAGDMANIRAAGFKTIRLQVNWRSQSDSHPPHTIDPKWLARVSDMLDAAQAHGLTVILDNQNFFLHDPDPGSKASLEWLRAVWKQLARHFAAKPPADLWFELANEPNEPFNNANLMDKLGPSLGEIRKVSRTRPVIIGGERSSRVESLETLTLPDDPNVWPTFHYYEPFFFTHQGATWGKGKVPPLGRVYGVLSDAERRARMPGDAERLAADVEKVRAYIRRTGRIPFIGESGAFDPAPLPQRVAYVRTIHQAFTPLGVPQCFYSYTNNFEFYNRQAAAWLPGMLEAIGLHDPGPLRQAPAGNTATR